MARYQKRGLKLKADYEHQSLAKPPIIAPAAAKKWTPVVRNGELWATEIQWTRKARQMIADGEYDYFSIAGVADKQTNRLTEIINFALTNNPAADGIEPFIATAVSNPQTENRMNTVIIALGLRADAGEADALAAVSQLKDFEREMIALSGKTDRASALGAVRAMQSSHEKVVALTAEVAAARAEKRGLEFDALVKQGDADKKISPAMAKDWIPSLRGREDGCEILKSFLASATALVPVDGEKKPVELVQDASAPSAEEYAVAKAFVGDDEEAIKKRIADVRALTKGKV